MSTRTRLPRTWRLAACRSASPSGEARAAQIARTSVASAMLNTHRRVVANSFGYAS